MEEYPDDDPFGELLQEVLRYRLLEFTGEYKDGKLIYMRTAHDEDE